MKKVLVTTLLLLALVGQVLATDHTALTGSSKHTYGLTLGGDVDWTFYDTLGFYPEGITIYFRPGAINDVICVLDGDGGPPLLHETSTDGRGSYVYWTGKTNPFIDYSACTFTAGATITFGWE